jgi:hypothetical protein
VAASKTWLAAQPVQLVAVQLAQYSPNFVHADDKNNSKRADISDRRTT